jgi:hypothetical protein
MVLLKDMAAMIMVKLLGVLMKKAKLLLIKLRLIMDNGMVEILLEEPLVTQELVAMLLEAIEPVEVLQEVVSLLVQ